ncbi:hypothetical protein [Guptibacillus spartinae]|uniref:hypothetical protein n=1 Tax=Guptibacillus spartinae TaxID=3025679 RepID=UPI002360F7A6|nr:hypothetical protein [Pseudalkalibacillus spartinae]
MKKEVEQRLNDNGLELKPAMEPPEGSKGLYLFDSLYSVIYNNNVVLYLRINDNNTFDTIELLNFRSSFRPHMKNISLEKVIDVLQSVIANKSA